MYTPVPKHEKDAARKEWRAAMERNLPRILEASWLLQRAMEIGAPRAHFRPVVKPWEMPQALQRTFIVETVSTDFAACEDGWAIPGASAFENYVAGYQGSPESDRRVQHAESEASSPTEVWNGADNGGDDLGCSPSSRSTHSNISPSTPFDEHMNTATIFFAGESDPGIGVSPATPMKQVMSNTPFVTPSAKLVCHTPYISLGLTSILSTEHTTPSTTFPKPLQQFSLLKHIFVNHSDNDIDAEVSLASTTCRRRSAHAAHMEALSQLRQDQLGSPYEPSSAQEHKYINKVEKNQHQHCRCSFNSSPSQHILPPSAKHPIFNNAKGTTDAPIHFDLTALQNGELRIYGYTHLQFRSTAPDVRLHLEHHAGITPMLQRANVNLHAPDTPLKSLPLYWTPGLHRNVDHWLQSNDTTAAVVDLCSITLGTMASPETTSITGTLHSDAAKIRLIHLRLPSCANGLLTQAQPLDWVVVEICWNLPCIAGIVIAFPRRCITSVHEDSGTITWKLLEQSLVPAISGVSVDPRMFEHFMRACALGMAVIVMKL